MPEGGERRYTESEVARILERAASAERAVPPQTRGSEGLTLDELQEIGTEVGLSPALIADAAAAIERPAAVPLRMQHFGIPVGVGRTFRLDRSPTQEEWERMVVRFRETFAARGRVRSDGSLREWTNGNLQAIIEPAESGYVLRFRTYKSESGVVLGLGAAALVGALALVLLTVVGSMSAAESLVPAALLGLAGLWPLGWGTLHLPRWAVERDGQFDRLGAEAQRLLGGA